MSWCPLAPKVHHNQKNMDLNSDMCSIQVLHFVGVLICITVQLRHECSFCYEVAVSLKWMKAFWESKVTLLMLKCYTNLTDHYYLTTMHGCESWIIKQAECWRIDDAELWCWRRLLRVLWTEGRSSQSILKEINPEYSLEGLMLKLKL